MRIFLEMAMCIFGAKIGVMRGSDARLARKMVACAGVRDSLFKSVVCMYVIIRKGACLYLLLYYLLTKYVCMYTHIR